MTPALVLCGHGTRDPLGRQRVREVVDAVAASLPGVAVHEAYVDVHGPEVGEVVASLPRATDGGTAGVVVPLLLAAGYHVRVDLADAVRDRPDVVVTGALGPDHRLVDVVLDRLAEAAATDADAIVLAPAGSSDERSQADSRETGRRLEARAGTPVRVAYAAGARPPVACGVTAARIEGARRVVVASYLLAPGFFQRRIEGSGADVVSGPLLPDRRVAEVVLDRYRAAVG